MVKLFISYRRSDTQDFAGRLYDHMSQSFKPVDVFMDVDSIAPGENFVRVLEEKLEQTDVMLVVIGQNWLTARDSSGRRRLDQPADFVRKEIASALKRSIAVIPVLNGSTAMPTANELPDELASLAHKQSVTIWHSSFRHDADRLADAIKRHSKQNNSFDWTEFGKAITNEYNKHFIISTTGEDYKLQVFYGSETSKSTYFHSHLLKDALTHLIEEADLDDWMKHESELSPEEFWAALLKAIATSYRYQVPYPTDNVSDADIIRQLLSELDDLSKS